MNNSRYLVLILIIALLSLNYCYSQSSVCVAATSQWIFGIRDDLSFAWKIAGKGYRVVCSSDGYFLAINPNVIPPMAFAARETDGQVAWSIPLSGIPMGCGTSTYKSLGPCFTIILDTGDSLRSEVRQTSTGRLLELTGMPKKAHASQSSACPLPSPADTLSFFQTPANVCSISPDLSIIWRQKLQPGEHLSASRGQLGFLVGKEHIRTLDKNSGREIWKRMFERDIRGIGSGRVLTISFVDGTVDTLDVQTGMSIPH